MNILALEAYYDGSHRAFLDQWINRSRHQWSLMTLPGYKWKWRMRHSAVTFAQQIHAALTQGDNWDLMFCSDMVNLAECRGLLPPVAQALPTVVYFHENQITYPVRFEHERDYQFAMTNLTSALAADQVWFNSRFHRDSFLQGLKTFLNRMPDYQPMAAIEDIQAKSSIHYPGIPASMERPPRSEGPPHILWAARWEHDKNPEDFFAALVQIQHKGLDFRLSVIGQHFRDIPPAFAQARQQLSDHIVHWGYQPSRQAYQQVLSQADIVVSTAQHEFYGIGMLEAIAAGAYPLLPRRLSYPELLHLDEDPQAQCFFYDGTVAGLAQALTQTLQRTVQGRLWPASYSAQKLTEPFTWKHQAPSLDEALEKVIGDR